jgi:hypothetical protein
MNFNFHKMLFIIIDKIHIAMLFKMISEKEIHKHNKRIKPYIINSITHGMSRNSKTMIHQTLQFIYHLINEMSTFYLYDPLF